jgi:hypothetical protein
MDFLFAYDEKHGYRTITGGYFKSSAARPILSDEYKMPNKNIGLTIQTEERQSL